MRSRYTVRKQERAFRGFHHRGLTASIHWAVCRDEMRDDETEFQESEAFPKLAKRLWQRASHSARRRLLGKSNLSSGRARCFDMVGAG